MTLKWRMEQVRRLADMAEEAMAPKPPSEGYPKGRPGANSVCIPGGACLSRFTKEETEYLLTRFKEVRGPGVFGYVEFRK